MAVGLGPLSTLHPVPGFELGIASAGIKRPGRKDVVVMRCAEGSRIAGVTTTNAFCAAPVLITRERMHGPVRYLLTNTGNANAGTGADGLARARRACARLAELAGVAESAVLPFSTGVIGEPLPVEKVSGDAVTGATINGTGSLIIEATRVGDLGRAALAVEDALAGGERAKLDRYGEDSFMVLHPARYIDRTETVEFGELSVFTGEHYVVTVRHAEEPDLAAVRRSLETEGRERLAMGPWQVTLEILDRVVDDYFPVADGLEQDIAEIEDQVFAGDGHVSRRIYELSREVLNFQHAIRALPSIVEQLQEEVRTRLHEDTRRLDADGLPRRDDAHAWEDEELSEQARLEVENLRRLRDVHDHAVQINERVTTMRQMLNSALELDSTLASKRLAEQSIAQNEQVKQISSWAAIIFAPQLVGSVYGMNFDGMPELHWAFGYPFALGLMLAVALTLFVLFKRADWL